MGYKREAKQYRLRFEDHPGFVVVMRGLSVEKFLGLVRLAGALSGLDLATAKGPELDATLAAVDELFASFAAGLVSWNLDDDEDQAVPPTLAGVTSLDLDFVLELVMGWMEAMTSVPPPLPKTSSGGKPALEGSLPMAPLSPSRAS